MYCLLVPYLPPGNLQVHLWLQCPVDCTETSKCSALRLPPYRLALVALAAGYAQVQVKALCLVQVLPALQQWPWQAPSTPHMPMPPQGSPACSWQLAAPP
jgi:hypothetical protein